MPQKYGRYVLEKNNLSIGYGDDSGIAKLIENISTKHAIKTQRGVIGLADVIEPMRSSALEQIFEQIGGVSAIYGYQTYVDGEIANFIIVCSDSLLLYYYRLDCENPTLDCFNTITLSSVPNFETFCIDDKNMLIISSVDNVMWVWDGENTPYEVLDSPKFTSTAVGLDKLFVTTIDKPYSIFYSEDYDPTTWSMSSGDIAEINFSDNMGSVIKAVSLDNYVFVIREFGINKIYLKTNGEISVSKIFFSAGRIYKNTIKLCSDHIVFLTDGGLFKFDGVTTKKLCENISVIDANYEDSFAECCGNEYYLFFTKNNENSYVLIFDIMQSNLTEICSIIKASYAFGIHLNEYNFVGFITNENLQKNAKMPYVISKNYQNQWKSAQYLFESQTLNLEPEEVIKTILWFEILANSNIQLSLLCDKTEKKYNIESSNHYQKFMVGTTTKKLSIKLISDVPMQVDSIVIHYSYQGRK